MAKEKTDVEVIVDDGDVIALTSGTEVRLLPLKTRQFFKLLRIITHGSGNMLLNIRFDPDDSPEDFGKKLLALIAFAVPDAEDEVIDFLLAMVEPVEKKEGRNLSKEEQKLNAQFTQRMIEELYNPELEDTLALIGALVKRESADLQALGKRLTTMFNLAKETGQVPEGLLEENQSSQDENS